MPVRFVRKTVGLLGGSFNPAHDGHRHISLQALKLLGLDEVWWLVSPLNPLKQAKDMASYDRRVASAEKIASHPRIKVSRVEQEINTRYTIDTISKLQKMYPDISFVWLMGADNLLEFHHWYCWRSIMHAVPIAVLPEKLCFKSSSRQNGTVVPFIPAPAAGSAPTGFYETAGLDFPADQETPGFGNRNSQQRFISSRRLKSCP